MICLYEIIISSIYITYSIQLETLTCKGNTGFALLKPMYQITCFTQFHGRRKVTTIKTVQLTHETSNLLAKVKFVNVVNDSHEIKTKKTQTIYTYFAGILSKTYQSFKLWLYMFYSF